MLRACSPLQPTGSGLPRRDGRAAGEWLREYRRQMAPVADAWSHLSRVIRSRPRAAWGVACTRFAGQIEALEESRILPAPDPAVSLHLSRGLSSLRQAAAACRQQRIFALADRLAMARRALLEVERLIGRGERP